MYRVSPLVAGYTWSLVMAKAPVICVFNLVTAWHGVLRLAGVKHWSALSICQSPRMSDPHRSCPIQARLKPRRVSAVVPITATLEHGTLALEGEITRTRLPFSLNEM